MSLFELDIYHHGRGAEDPKAIVQPFKLDVLNDHQWEKHCDARDTHEMRAASLLRNKMQNLRDTLEHMAAMAAQLSRALTDGAQQKENAESAKRATENKAESSKAGAVTGHGASDHSLKIVQGYEGLLGSTSQSNAAHVKTNERATGTDTEGKQQGGVPAPEKQLVSLGKRLQPIEQRVHELLGEVDDVLSKIPVDDEITRRHILEVKTKLEESLRKTKDAIHKSSHDEKNEEFSFVA